MLFMGSEKHPQYNEYEAFISINSGHTNASTSDTETIFFFEVKNRMFDEAVERFTDFFISALLLPECIEKEVQAVHEECVLWSNNDNCRKWEVLRKLGVPPYSRFSIGNTETLKHEHIREDLVKFYKHYYSANIINAVVSS
jgi:secreted Zn-dependent insulinase-like peptidase